MLLVQRGLHYVVEAFDVFAEPILAVVNTVAVFGFDMLAQVFGAVVAAGAVGAGGVDALGVIYPADAEIDTGPVAGDVSGVGQS